MLLNLLSLIAPLYATSAASPVSLYNINVYDAYILTKEQYIGKAIEAKHNSPGAHPSHSPHQTPDM